MKDLGYGWSCPYCGLAQDEGQKTGVYWHSKPVCALCAPNIQALRESEKPKSGIAIRFVKEFDIEVDPHPTRIGDGHD